MNKRLLLLLLTFFSLSSPVLAQDPTFEEQSLAAFRSADLGEIENVHCLVYQSDRTNAQAAFGCFFVRALRVLESRPFTQALALLGEPAINLQRDIFDPANPDALCTELGRGALTEGRQSWFQEFPNLPFNNYRFGSLETFFGREFLVRLRNSGRNAGASFSTMRSYLINLDASPRGLLSELIDMLAVARNTPNFQFIIPREICPVHPTRMHDIVVQNIDLEGFHAALGSIKIFIELLRSYTIGLNPYWFVAANGDILERRFVEDANGVRPNRMKFVERFRGSQDRSDLLPLLRSTLNSFILLVDSVHSEDDSYIFGRLLNGARHSDFFQRLYPYARDITNSLDYPDAFQPMTESGNENIQINVTAFFRSLPNPADVTSSDPFVVTGASTPPRRTDRLHVRPVTQFFRDLFANFATF